MSNRTRYHRHRKDYPTEHERILFDLTRFDPHRFERVRNEFIVKVGETWYDYKAPGALIKACIEGIIAADRLYEIITYPPEKNGEITKPRVSVRILENRWRGREYVAVIEETLEEAISHAYCKLLSPKSSIRKGLP